MGEIRPKKCEGRELTKDQLAAAKAVCSRDIRCGGVLSRSCDEQSNGTSGCKRFQTRSGMSEEGCHAGVPCANRRPHALPEPAGTGWQEQQNSYPITNAQACGHTPGAAPPPSPATPDHGATAHAHAAAVWATMTEVDPVSRTIIAGNLGRILSRVPATTVRTGRYMGLPGLAVDALLHHLRRTLRHSDAAVCGLHAQLYLGRAGGQAGHAGHAVRVRAGLCADGVAVRHVLQYAPTRPCPPPIERAGTS